MRDNMEKRIALLIFVSLLALNCVTAQFIPRSNLQVNLGFTIDAVETTYTYVVQNDSSSVQSMETLRLEVGDVDSIQGGTIRGFQNPAHWTGWIDNVVAQPRDYTAKAIIVWGIADTIASIDDMYTLPANAVQPGATITVSFKSQGLPSIKRFWARGWAPPLTEQAYDSLRELGQTHGDIIKPWFVDAYIGKTIAPRIPPTPFVPLSFIDTLIAMKNEAKTLGWIQESDLSDLIDTRLSKARDHLESEDESGALEDLQAALNAVEHDCLGMGPVSYLTSEACALLRYNIEYLMEQLE